jgi:hypothetical protein
MHCHGITETSIFKINKDGTNEKKPDSGYVADLIIHQNKVYLSDIIKIYELNQYRNYTLFVLSVIVRVDTDNGAFTHFPICPLPF